MHYAYVDGVRREPEPGLHATCGFCKTALIAHCGDYKVWHWHHKSKRGCDPWWEQETEWHRNWKNLFPGDQQEVIQHDATGEKHIADVKNTVGKVFEFQHSILKKDELLAREAFYEDNLVWVVDGLRSDFDHANFGLGLEGLWPNFRVTWYSTSKLWHRWAEAKKPVFLDFGTDIIWRLDSFDPREKIACLKAFKKQVFIKHAGANPDEKRLDLVMRSAELKKRTY